MKWTNRIENYVMEKLKMEIRAELDDKVEDGLLTDEKAQYEAKRVLSKIVAMEEFMSEVARQVISNLNEESFEEAVGMMVINAMEEMDMKGSNIEKGKVYEIAPSDGFLGIEPGKVKVIRIAEYEDVCEEYADPESLVEVDPELRGANWIVYKYENGEAFCLDEETFEEHIVK